MRAIRLLALRRLRLQPLRSLVAAVTVGAGVALAIAVLVVTSSLTASLRESGRSLAGPTSLRVVGATSRGGIAPDVVDRVRATPGVGTAIPLVQAVTLAEDAHGHQTTILAFGFDCSIQAIVGPFGCDPNASSDAAAAPAVSPSLARTLGAGAVLRTDLGRIPLDGAPAFAGLDRLNGGLAVAFPMHAAQAQLGRGDQVDVVYVAPAPGVRDADLKVRLQQVVGPSNGVLGADDPPPAVGFLLAAFLPFFTLLAALALGVGIVLVHNSVALSVEERRRQLAIVGALGGDRRVVVGGTLAEAGALGLIGGLLGAVGGVLVAHPVMTSLSSFTRKLAGVGLTVHVSASVVVIAALLGTFVGVAAAWRPARRATRLDIAAELSNRDRRDEAAPATSFRRALVWASIAVIGIDLCAVASDHGALHPWQAALAPVAMIFAVLACTLFVSAFVPIALRWFGPRLVRGRGTAELALANLVREPGRTGVVAVAVGMAVGTAFMAGSFTTSARTGITNSITSHLKGVSVSTLEPSNTVNIDAKLTPQELDQLAHVPGAAKLYRSAVVVTGHDAGRLVGVRAFEDTWLDAPLIEGSKSLSGLDAGEALIGPALARETGARPGGTVTLDTPGGQVQVPVLGIVQEGDFGGRNVTVSYPLLEQLYGPQPVASVNVTPAPGVSPEQLAANIRAAGLDPGLRVRTPTQLADEVSRAVADQISSFWTVQRGLMVMAFVAVVSTLLLIGIQRRRELGLLAAIGMRPSELARMVLAEAALVALAGIAVAAAVSVAMFGALLLVATVLIGYPDPFVLDGRTLALYAVIGFVLALAGAAWPAWRTSRIEVLDALRYD